MNKAFQIFIRLIFLIVSNSLNASEDLTLNTTENPIFERIWKFEINRKDYFNTVQAKPKEFEGLLLFVDGENIFALNKYTGSLVYKTNLGTSVGRRGFTIDHDREYVAITASSGGRVGSKAGATLFLLDVKSGKILKKASTNYSVVEPILTSDCIITSGARNGIVQCHDHDLQEVVWRTELGSGSRVWSNPVLSEKLDIIYLVTSDTGTIVNANRSDDRYSSSLIGISAKTGLIMFSRQMIKTGLWDFDGVGKPILIENFINEDGKIYDLIVGLNKTGTVFVLNAEDGTDIKSDQFKEISFLNEYVQETNLSPTQTIPSWPSRLTEISLTPKELRMEEARPEIFRHVKYGQFVAPSLNYDVVTRGLHGGPEWYGGEHFRKNGEDYLAVPFNNTSWILRLKYVEDFWLGYAIPNYGSYFYKFYNYIENLFNKKEIKKKNSSDYATSNSPWKNIRWSDSTNAAQQRDKLYKLLKWNAYNENYDKKCASCHRNDRAGKFQNELSGDGFVPPLVGYTLTKKYDYGGKIAKFKLIHNQDLDVEQKDLDEIFQHFDKYDKKKLAKKQLKVTGYWQALLGKDKLPLNKGPWGGVGVINLNSGLKLNDIVVGQMKSADGKVVDSSIIFGGLGEINSKGETLLVGTVDPRAYYISIPEGKVLQTIKLERPGSVQPHLTTIRGCEAWIVLETGGRFSLYDKSLNGYTIEAFINTSICD